MSDFDQRRPHDDGDFHDLADPLAPDHVEARVAAVVGAGPLASARADAADDASDRLLRALTAAYAPPADMEAALARVYARLPLEPPALGAAPLDAMRGGFPRGGGASQGDMPDIPRRPRPARRPGAAETFLRVAAAAILVALLGGGFYALFRLRARGTTAIPSATPTIVPTVTPLPSPTPSPTPVSGPAGPSITGAPVEANGVVYMANTNGVLSAFDASHGTALWRYRAAAKSAGAVVVANGVVYFDAEDPAPAGSHGGIPYLVAVATSTGKPLWRVTIPNPVAGPILVRNGAIYLGTAESDVLALRASDGSQIWRYSTGGCASGAIATDGTNLYINAVSCAGLLAVRLSDGKFLWNAGLDVSGLPVIANGVVYLGPCAVTAATGARLWCAAIDNPRDEAQFTGTDALVNGKLFVCLDDHTYTFQASSGSVIGSPWLTAATDIYVQILAVGGGMLYSVNYYPPQVPADARGLVEPMLYAMPATIDPGPEWTPAPTLLPVTATYDATAPGGPVLYVTTTTGQLYAIAPSTGNVLWQAPITG